MTEGYNTAALILQIMQGIGMLLRTTENYDPYRNAVAERINEILKYEFGMVNTIADVKLAKKIIAQAVEIYNKKRRHRSLGMSTPDQAHKNNNHVYKFYGQCKQKAETTNVDKVKKSFKYFFRAYQCSGKFVETKNNFYNKKWSTYFRVRQNIKTKEY